MLIVVCVFALVQFNPLLRDIFGLGPPLILDATVKGNKISRFEKVTAALLSLNLNLHNGKGVYNCIFQYFSTHSRIHAAAREVQLQDIKKVILCDYSLRIKYKYCCIHVFLSFLFNSISSTQLPSRPGLNRGTKSGTNGPTSCKRRARMEYE